MSIPKYNKKIFYDLFAFGFSIKRIAKKFVFFRKKLKQKKLDKGT